jgi:large subunit ribosomal protein L17
MRHRAKRSNFHRRIGPRVALIRGMVYSLVEHGRIKTTVARAKEVRRHVEKAITVGKGDSLHARRLLLARYPNEAVVSKLVGDLKDRFAKRPGGYTRIIKVGARAGDQADLAYLEFVDFTPKATQAETVKGDKGVKLKMRAKAAGQIKAKKRVRTIQSASRREARA